MFGEPKKQLEEKGWECDHLICVPIKSRIVGLAAIVVVVITVVVDVVITVVISVVVAVVVAVCCIKKKSREICSERGMNLSTEIPFH